jgi:hypothetical protein
MLHYIESATNRSKQMNAAKIIKTADDAAKAYDAYIFSSVGRAFDAFKADMLAANAAEAFRAAVKLGKKIGTSTQYDQARADEFAEIAGSLA